MFINHILFSYAVTKGPFPIDEISMCAKLIKNEKPAHNLVLQR